MSGRRRLNLVVAVLAFGCGSGDDASLSDAGVDASAEVTRCCYRADPASASSMEVQMFHCTYARWTSNIDDDPIKGDEDAEGNPITVHSLDPNSGSPPTRTYFDSAANYSIIDGACP